MEQNLTKRKLSIITVTYKDSAGLTRTLNSLQPLKDLIPFEVIVVDSSPELNEMVLRDTGLPLKRVISPPKGIYSAMNEGTNAADGQYLWFLNGGDELTSLGPIKDALDVLQSKQRALLIAPVEIWKNGRFSHIHHSKLPGSLLGVNSVCHQGVIYPREVFSNSYKTEFRIAADYVHLLEAREMGFEFISFHQEIAKFHKGGTSDQILPALREFWRIHCTNPMGLSFAHRILQFFFLFWKSLIICLKRAVSLALLR